MTSIIANFGNWGWFAKSSAIIYATPVLTWSLGAAEGAVRTAFECLSTAYSKASGNDPAAAQHWDQTKRDAGIALSCVLLTGVSAVPLLGTGCGYYYIISECTDLQNIRDAYKRAIRAQGNAYDQEIIQELDHLTKVEEASLKALFERMINPSPINGPVTLLERDRNLKASLIHHYYGYSIPYLTIEYTCHGIQSTISLTQRIAVQLFKNGFFKKIVKSAIIAVYSEVQQTKNDVAVDEQLHPIFARQPPQPRRL